MSFFLAALLSFPTIFYSKSVLILRCICLSIDIGSRLTGWNAVKSRAEQLELEMTDDEVKDVTNKIKAMADLRTQSMSDVDTILRVFHRGIKSGKLGLRQPAVFDALLAEHKSEAGSEAGDSDVDGPAKKKAKSTNGTAVASA